MRSFLQYAFHVLVSRSPLTSQQADKQALAESMNKPRRTVTDHIRGIKKTLGMSVERNIAGSHGAATALAGELLFDELQRVLANQHQLRSSAPLVQLKELLLLLGMLHRSLVLRRVVVVPRPAELVIRTPGLVTMGRTCQST